MFTRVFLLIMDSVGIGALPDATNYNDAGANTLGNTARASGGLFLPVMNQLGLGAISPIQGLEIPQNPQGFFGKMAEMSRAKDTTSGHWELAGHPVFTPFPVYPDGFPADMIETFTRLSGRPVLGNKAASGTEIIAELGAEHMRTGYPIVYTSADSVFQVAAHEEVIRLEELYHLCRIARDNVCQGKNAVGRVIARPFIGQPGNFVRTPNRHDYSLEPSGPTVLDALKERGHNVLAVGKISDIFCSRGITKPFSTLSNDHGMATLLQLLGNNGVAKGLILANLVDFDSKYGHRRNAIEYGRALERFDGQLALLLDALCDDDLLILTADHGCDPTFPGTDHTREYVPLLVFYRHCKGESLGTRQSFADVGQTVAEIFDLPKLPYGHSFLADIAR